LEEALVNFDELFVFARSLYQLPYQDLQAGTEKTYENI
jgi:hypothetical protein